MIIQFFIVDQIPLTTSVFIAPTISFSWEINPFGMAKLISHEVKIASVYGGSGYQTNHLMECNASKSNVVFISNLEMPIHISINQTENERLIPY